MAKDVGFTPCRADQYGEEKFSRYGDEAPFLRTSRANDFPLALIAVPSLVC
jgi:hypothetical protein